MRLYCPFLRVMKIKAILGSNFKDTSKMPLMLESYDHLPCMSSSY